jgi:glutamate--cysteine ligase
VEVRCVDLNPYEPLGITVEQMRVMDSFLLYCLLSDSPETDEREFYQGQENQKRVVNQGRDPELQLLAGDKTLPMGVWANALLTQMQTCARLLDQALDTQAHSQALVKQQQKLENPALTPSAQILRDMADKRQSFNHFSLALAEQHRQYFQVHPLGVAEQERYTQLSQISLAEQKQLEQSQTLGFDEYLANYYAQYQGCRCSC